MSKSLTKDADALICILYKSYIQQVKNGIQKSKAKIFEGSDFIHKELMSKWDFDRVDETCRELHRADLLFCDYVKNVVYWAELTDDAIIYMENRFKDGLNEVLDYIQKIRAIVIG